MSQEDQVIRDKVTAALRLNQPVNQKELAPLFPYLTAAALNSRVSRMKRAIKMEQAYAEIGQAPKQKRRRRLVSSAKTQENTRLEAAINLAALHTIAVSTIRQVRDNESIEHKGERVKEKGNQTPQEASAEGQVGGNAEENVVTSSTEAERIEQLTAELDALRKKLANKEDENEAKQKIINAQNKDLKVLQKYLDDARTKNTSDEKRITELSQQNASNSKYLDRQWRNLIQEFSKKTSEAEDEHKILVQNLKRKNNQEMEMLSRKVSALEEELMFTRWVTDVHCVFTMVNEKLQQVADVLSPYLDGRQRTCLYSSAKPDLISIVPVSRWSCCLMAIYYKWSYDVEKEFEADLDKWRKDRNQFAHHSDLDSLVPRDIVLKNAQRVHKQFANLLNDLLSASEQDLTWLARDGFNLAFP